MAAEQVYMSFYDVEQNLVGRKPVMPNQYISLAHLPAGGYIKFEIVKER